MPKMKTHKGLKKRVKLTAKGKVKYNPSFAGHLMSHKTGDHRRKLRRPSFMVGRPAVRVRIALSS